MSLEKVFDHSSGKYDFEQSCKEAMSEKQKRVQFPKNSRKGLMASILVCAKLI